MICLNTKNKIFYRKISIVKETSLFKTFLGSISPFLEI